MKQVLLARDATASVMFVDSSSQQDHSRSTMARARCESFCSGIHPAKGMILLQLVRQLHEFTRNLIGPEQSRILVADEYLSQESPA